MLLARQALGESLWLTRCAQQSSEERRVDEANAYQGLALRALLTASQLASPLRSLMFGPPGWLSLATRTRRGSASAMMVLVKLILLTLVAYLAQRVLSPALRLEQTLELVTWEAWCAPILDLLGGQPDGQPLPTVSSASQYGLTLQRFGSLWILVSALASPHQSATKHAQRLKRRLERS